MTFSNMTAEDYDSIENQKILDWHNKIRLLLLQGEDITAPIPAAVVAASLISKGITHHKIPFEQLPADVIQQLRSDGTRDHLRTISEAKDLYDSLPDSLDTLQDVRNVVSSQNYEASHHIPYSHGGADTANNVSYMPTDINRHMGDRYPTPQELHDSQVAVQNEGYINHNPYLEGAVHLAQGATAPLVARVAGTSVRFVGGMVRQDKEAINQALTELPGEISQGVTDGFTRGVPAVVGSTILGPVGLVGGIVAADFIEAAITDDDSHRAAKLMEGSAKAGVAAVLICNPPLAALAGTGWLIGKFFNAW